MTTPKSEKVEEAEILIKVEGVSKSYDPSRRSLSIKETFSDIFQKRSFERQNSLMALENVSFNVKKGEVLGIIGKNGAGKSTILRILSGITQPSSGKIIFKGKIASILEIGTGFHSELSGRENIYLSGTLLGMAEEEISKKEQEIITFSGISNFIDVPVKQYSSGMFLRLAFSISTHLDADILLIDEVLSVGDSAFKLKGFEKIKYLLSKGKAVVIVSHDLGSVLGLCDRIIILEKGKIISEGPPLAQINGYIEQTFTDIHEEKKENLIQSESNQEPIFSLARSWKPDNAPGNEWLKILSMSISKSSYPDIEEITMNDAIHFEIIYTKQKSIATNLSLFISWQLNQPLLSATPLHCHSDSQGNDAKKGLYRATAEFPPNWFNCGLFSAGLFFVTEGEKEKINLPDLIHFKIKKGKPFSGNFHYDGKFPGPLFPAINWKTTLVTE